MSTLPLLIRRQSIQHEARKTAMLYLGSCHCGRVAFEVEGKLGAAISCNCSICSRKGALLWAVDADRLRLIDPNAELGDYVFNKREIHHRFCRNCGIHTHAEGDGWTAVNVRCLQDLDLATVVVMDFDGRSV